jgi:hypothetical protein
MIHSHHETDIAQLPRWAVRITDGEVLAMVSIHLGVVLERGQMASPDDHRALELFAFEAAQFFCERHRDSDWGLDDFTDHIYRFTDQLEKALVAEVGWINRQYHAMYGSETVKDLLARHPIEEP